MSRSRKGLSRKWSVLEKRAEKAESLAADRLRLLREMHEVIVAEPLVCPVCGVLGCRDDGLCDLAEELK